MCEIERSHRAWSAGTGRPRLRGPSACTRTRHNQRNPLDSSKDNNRNINAAATMGTTAANPTPAARSAPLVFVPGLGLAPPPAPVPLGPIRDPVAEGPELAVAVPFRRIALR